MIIYRGLSLENHCTVGELNRGGHCEAIMYFDESAAAGSVSHCTFQTISDYGCGCRRFVSHADVETSTATGEYLRNDCLVIRLPKLQSIRNLCF